MTLKGYLCIASKHVRHDDVSGIVNF